VASLAAGAFLLNHEGKGTWYEQLDGLPPERYDGGDSDHMPQRAVPSHRDIQLAGVARINEVEIQLPVGRDRTPKRIMVSVTEGLDDAYRQVGVIAVPAPVEDTAKGGLAPKVSLKLDAPVKARRLRVSLLDSHSLSPTFNKHSVVKIRAYGELEAPPPVPENIGGVYSRWTWAITPGDATILVLHQDGDSITGCAVKGRKVWDKIDVKNVLKVEAVQAKFVGGWESGVYRFVRTDVETKAGVPGYMVLGPKDEGDRIAYGLILDKDTPKGGLAYRWEEVDTVPCEPSGAKDAVSEELDEHGHMALYGINFAVDSARLQGESAPLLDKVVVWLKANPNAKLDIEGHTDDTGGAAHNQKLSEARAQTVKAYFVKAGIAAERLGAAGYGASKPMGANDGEANRAQNRRVEILKR